MGRARVSRENPAGEAYPAVDGAAGGPGDQAAGGSGDQAAGDGGDQAAGGPGDQAVDGASGGAPAAKKKFCWNCQAPGGQPVKLKKCSGCRTVRCTFNSFLSRNFMKKF